jgi:phosphoserine phosphatase
MCIDTLEETAMLKVESFYSHQVGVDAADVRAVVASTTQQANETLANWKKSGLAVNVLSASTQLALEGSDAAYVLTLVVDLQRSEEDEDEVVTDEDVEFE